MIQRDGKRRCLASTVTSYAALLEKIVQKGIIAHHGPISCGAWLLVGETAGAPADAKERRRLKQLGESLSFHPSFQMA